MYHKHTIAILFTTFITTASAQDYCVPVIPPGTSSGAGIQHVALGGGTPFDRSSYVSEGYVLTGDTTSLLIGAQYTLDVTRTSGPFCADNNLRAYLDFNGDQQFSESTETIALINEGGEGEEHFDFVVPMSADRGWTRLRVMLKWYQGCGQVAINSCGTGDSTGYHGEVEDYTIWINGQVGVEENDVRPSMAQVIDGGLLVFPSTSRPFTVELFDPSGRLLLSRGLSSASDGPGSFPLPPELHGIVLLRLNEGGRYAQQRLFIP